MKPNRLEEPLVPRFPLGSGAEEEAMSDLFGAFRLSIFKYPAAARKLFSAFVEEGRQFAQTTEGLEWKRKIEASTLLPGLQEALDATTLRLLMDEPGKVLPSTLLDVFFTAALRKNSGIGELNSEQNVHG